MSIPVPLEELAAALERRSNTAYLLTVGEDGTAHCVAATLEWTGDELTVPAGKTSVHNAEARGHVVLLSPPALGLGSPPPGDDGYSLIVDAAVTATSHREDAKVSSVRLRPTHAVLHRPAVAPDGGHAHDCVHVFDEA